MESIDIEIEKDKDKAYPALNFRLKRINILLGINGSGKSKLLKKISELPSSARGGLHCHYISSNRDIGNLVKNAHAKQFSNFSVKRSVGQDEIAKDINERIAALIKSLADDHLKKDEEYKAGIAGWVDSEKAGKEPVRVRTQFDELSNLCASSMNGITMSLSRVGGFNVKRNDKKYSIGDLSDGEKQLLLLLIDFAKKKPSKAVIVVDEPELHLHPTLANSYWCGVEKEFPESYFIYATHSIQFAMREDDAQIIVIPSDGSDGEILKNWSEFESNEKNQFLGGIPEIVNAKKVICIEGGENDKKMLKELFDLNNKSSLYIAAMGSWHEVEKAVRGEGLWGECAPAVTISGLVDRDYRTSGDIERLKRANIEITDWHEIETYLYHPDVATLIAPNTIDKSEVVNAVTNRFKSEYLNVARCRIVERCQREVPFELTITDEENGALKTREDLIRLVRSKVEDYKDQIYNKEILSSRVTDFATKELIRCEQAIEKKDLNEILILLPGKILAGVVPQILNLTNGDYLRKVVGLKAEICLLEVIKSLRSKLKLS